MTDKKPIDPHDVDAAFLIPYYRNLSFVIAEKIKHLPITPMQITFIAHFLGFLSGFFFYLAEYKYLVIGVIVIFLSNLLDFLDGSLARIRKERTRLGGFTDYLGDAFKWTAMFLGITLGVYKNTNDISFLILGFLATTSYILARLAYEVYLRYFSEVASDIIKTQKARNKIITQFFYDGQQLLPIIMISALINKLDWLLILFGTYGPIFIFIEFFIMRYKIKKIDPRGFPKD